MKQRITLLIPGILVVFTLASSLLVYTGATRSAASGIRSEALNRIRLDISRLQNFLYNQISGSHDDMPQARLTLSITAMDPSIRSLMVTDGKGKILMANQYKWIDSPAASVTDYRLSIAHDVIASSKPWLSFTGTDMSLIQGYFPVVLELENDQGRPKNRLGILFVESSIAARLAAAKAAAATAAWTFGGVMLLAAAFIGLLLHLLVSRRLQQLAKTAEALAGGDLEARADIAGNDELSQLGGAFDEMAHRIKANIHSLEAAEEELRELNETLELRISERTEQLQEAQRIALLGNWQWDIATREVSCSDEVYRIFGYAPGEIALSHMAFLGRLNPHDLEQLEQAKTEALQGKQQISLDQRIMLPDDHTRWVHIEAVPAYGHDGQLTRLAGTIQDVTERKRIEQSLVQAKEEAERASRSKSEFLSHMSHELRTPLNAILGFSQVLQMDLEDAGLREHVDEIYQAGEHLLNLISELLDMSRIEAGRMAIVMRGMDTEQVIRDSLKVVLPLAKERDISISSSCDHALPVIADSTRLKQILINLLSNAIKYNRHGGSVSMHCEPRDGERLRISVSDTGAGIEAAQLPKLFTPFERLGAKYSGIDGTGIGLALSRQLAELMGGELGVDSIPGQGSTFWLELSLAHHMPPAAASSVMQTDRADPVRCRVLYIEDNTANFKVVQAMISHQPELTLLSARNGAHGLELADTYQPDVILLDIHLPDMDGYQVLQQLRQNPRTVDIPVIALSADAMPVDVEKGQNAGFNDYLTKPVKFDELTQAIARYWPASRTEAAC